MQRADSDISASYADQPRGGAGAGSGRCGRCRLALGRPRGNRGAIDQPQLAIGHHRFTAFQPAADDRLAALRALDDHGPDFGDAVLDDEHVGALRAELDGGGGDRDGLRLDTENHLHLDELPGPQALVGVVDARLGGHRSGVGIDGILDERHRARLPLGLVDDGVDPDRPLGHRGAQIGQDHLRDREGHEDRIDLVDGGEHARHGVVGDADDRAGLARDRADAAGHRRADFSEAELGKHVLATGVVGLELRLERLQRCGIGVALHDRAGALGQQAVGALGVALGLDDLRLVLADLGFDHAELGLERAVVELEQQVALLDQRALLDIDLHDLTVDARLDLDGGNRLHRADGLDDDRHRLLADRGHHHGHRAARIGPPAATLRLRDGRRTGRTFFGSTCRRAPAQSLGDLVTINIGSPADRNRDHCENRHPHHAHPRLSSAPAPTKNYMPSPPRRTAGTGL